MFSSGVRLREGECKAVDERAYDYENFSVTERAIITGTASSCHKCADLAPLFIVLWKWLPTR